VRYSPAEVSHMTTLVPVAAGRNLWPGGTTAHSQMKEYYS
jgi:hypothetical protein